MEYITESISAPNPGFETHPAFIEERKLHREVAGRLIAVHRLRPSAYSLVKIVGEEEFTRIQDMWATDGKRFRWSVAFPIVESYEVVGKPKAQDVLGVDSYRRLYRHASSTLRPFDAEEQRVVSNLEIFQRPTRNSWIGVEEEFEFAALSEVTPRFLNALTRDLSDKVLEGMEEERRQKVRRRAAWLADRMVKRRAQEGTLHCDLCEFDPMVRVAEFLVSPRTLLDVHHKIPLKLGRRDTVESDLALLCPTCHRFEHALMRVGKSIFGNYGEAR